MVTHTPTERVVRHFERLKLQSRLPCFLACHNSLPDSHSENTILVDDNVISRTMPNRNKERLSRSREINNGYVDIVAFTAASASALKSYDRIWILESDVDYAGIWEEFFSLYEGNEADIIGSRFRDRFEDPSWYHWPALKTPEGAARRGIFVPAMRVTRKFLATYLREIESGRWSGHTEATIGSIAATHDLVVEDMLRHTSPLAIRKSTVTLGTFDYKPVRSTAYFHEEPSAFGRLGYLYHPVKVAEIAVPS